MHMIRAKKHIRLILPKTDILKKSNFALGKFIDCKLIINY